MKKRSSSPKSTQFELITILSFCLIILLVNSCKQDRPTDGDELPNPDKIDYDALRRFVSGNTPPKDSLKLTGMTIRYIGQGKFTDEQAVEPNPDSLSEQIKEFSFPKELPFEKTGTHAEKWILFNGENQQEFEVEFSKELLKAVRERRKRKNVLEGSEGTGIPRIKEDSLEKDGMGYINVPKGYREFEEGQSKAMFTGWSRGIDGRIPFAPLNTRYPYRTIADLGGCSGAFIGPQHVITAGHCIYNRDSEGWYRFDVVPGRNGTDRPFGDTRMDNRTNPPGTWVWYWTPAAFRTPSATNNTHSPDDIGIIITPDRLGEVVGWMGKAALNSTELESRIHYLFGYPGCSFPEAPPSCIENRLYGDLNNCEFNNYSNPNPDGWNRVIRISCDAGRRNSGSPVFYFFEDPSRGTFPAVTSVFYWQNCSTCGAGQVFVNRVRRITPTELDIIDLFYDWTGD